MGSPPQPHEPGTECGIRDEHIDAPMIDGGMHTPPCLLSRRRHRRRTDAAASWVGAYMSACACARMSCRPADRRRDATSALHSGNRSARPTTARAVSRIGCIPSPRQKQLSASWTSVCAMRMSSIRRTAWDTRTASSDSSDRSGSSEAINSARRLWSTFNRSPARIDRVILFGTMPLYLLRAYRPSAPTCREHWVVCRIRFAIFP
jgi:hypothetical protein